MRQENGENAARFGKMQVIAIKCGKFEQKRWHVYYQCTSIWTDEKMQKLVKNVVMHAIMRSHFSKVSN